MPTVNQIIKRLLPTGSNLEVNESIDEFPRWPPDAFAVTATLVHLSGFYSHTRYIDAGNDGYFFSNDIRQKLKSVGNHWRPVMATRNGEWY